MDSPLLGNADGSVVSCTPREGTVQVGWYLGTISPPLGGISVSVDSESVCRPQSSPEKKHVYAEPTSLRTIDNATDMLNAGLGGNSTRSRPSPGTVEDSDLRPCQRQQPMFPLDREHRRDKPGSARDKQVCTRAARRNQGGSLSCWSPQGNFKRGPRPWRIYRRAGIN